jgi:uncharacterized membrane protein YccC
MTCPTRLALAAALALGLGGPVLAQPAGSSTQPGPQGSSPGPIGPQLQAAQRSLLTAEQQLSQSRSGDPNQPPNYEQARRAVMAAQDSLAEAKQAGTENRAIQDAERELAGARRLLEQDGADRGQVVNQLRTAANALTAVNSGATGPASNPGPATGGGMRQ